ncbi:hypothetical protein [Caldisericum exile]|uniref:Uncharacterized protein n=1 Tax=Caldisericum exile (strain DSM 21853 / NBRC 104410 / AZM16c01) TaxID=511051 RepID=A0A7U6JH87_CALEA|nr:hypothetical protein [Caldisericum exile]BAL81682.1 hypothetical protein CSE_15560 [Caldisericum exile AZM16c01]
MEGFGVFAGGLVIVYVILVVALAVLPFVWLHNISLNAFRSYQELKEIKEILKELKNK